MIPLLAHANGPNLILYFIWKGSLIAAAISLIAAIWLISDKPARSRRFLAGGLTVLGIAFAAAHWLIPWLEGI